jgi:group I intron endonuclease
MARWGKHLFQLRKGLHHSLKLQRHYNKYGESDLQFSILLGCDKENLIKIEQYFLDSYNPYFNNCKIAGSQLGRKASVDTIRKLSEKHKGQVAWNKGLKDCYSKETRNAISAGLTGKKQSSETVNKRIKKVKATWEFKRLMDEHHPKNPPWNKGKKLNQVILN